ncbi:MAG: hypothetical protein ABIV63_08400 [Caldimonas sp.]
MRIRSVAMTLMATTALAGCGGGGSTSNPQYVSQIAIPGVASSANYSFDISQIVGTKYYYTDRNSAAVQSIDITTLTSTGAITGTGATAFAGAKASNPLSGPDGVNAVGSLLYVGDVNSVKVVDPATKTVLKNIVVSSGGVRADEGCVDAAHHLYMISSPEEAVPFATFIDTNTQAVVAKVTFTDNKGAPSAGLEACAYDSSTDSFYVNNDGTTDNPHGELVRLPGAAIRAIAAGASVNYTALAGVTMSSEGNCDPTGLALGPDTDIAVGCREGTTGAPLLMQIMNRTTGALVASINAGGGDQLEYDATTNRYYNASSRWTATGNAATNGACSTASPCTPVLTIVDAATRTVVTRLSTGNNAHSVAVDPASGFIFMPISSATAPAGCGDCATNGFTSAGVAVFRSQ